MSYVYKNTTLNDLYHNRSGINFTANTPIPVDGIDVILTSTCPQMLSWISSGEIVFNDGSRDFGIVEALEHLKWSGSAKELWFDKSTNGFESERVQQAIEEAGRDGFSWKRLASGVKVHIREDRQMVVYQEHDVEDGSELIISGEMVVID